MKIVEEEREFLAKLAAARSTEKVRALIANASTRQLLALVEISMNVVKGRCELKPRHKKRLIPHAAFVRHLARARSERSARKLLIQEGDGPAIASLLAPILFELARTVITNI